MKKHIFAGLFALAAMPAQAAVLDFSGGVCVGGVTCNTGSIDQSYGDLIGVDVIWDGNPGDGINNSFLKWSSGYSDLTDVGYYRGGAKMIFNALSGFSVSLSALDLGAWGGDRQLGFSVTDLATNDQVFTSGLVNVSGSVRSSFAFDLSSSVGLVIDFFGDFYNGGVDNIVYDVQSADGSTAVPAPVPLPATGLLLGGALLGFGAWRRKG